MTLSQIDTLSLVLIEQAMTIALRMLDRMGREGLADYEFAQLIKQELEKRNGTV